MHPDMFHPAKNRILPVFSLFLFAAMRSSYSADAPATGSGGSGGLGNYGQPPFQVSVSLRGGYDDNLSNTKFSPQSTAFTNAGLSLLYKFGDARTQFNLEAGGGLTYYSNRVSGNVVDPNVLLNFSLTHKATARLTLTAKAYASYQQQPDFAFRFGLNRRSGNFFFTSDKFTASYLWTPRFATATSYTLGVVQYDSSASSFVNRIENTVGNEFRFLVWPTTTAVAEYRFQIVSYGEINRDSLTHFALAGVDHNFNPRLSASVRGGGQFRSYDSGGNRSSPYLEGTVNYALGKNTSLSWTNRYAIEEADVLFNRSRTAFRTGLQAKHNFTARIAGTLGAYYERDEYEGINMPPVLIPGFNEQSLDVAVAVRFAVTRYFGIEAGYNHTEIISDILLREYSRNRFYGGLNVTF